MLFFREQLSLVVMLTIAELISSSGKDVNDRPTHCSAKSNWFDTAEQGRVEELFDLSPIIMRRGY